MDNRNDWITTRREATSEETNVLSSKIIRRTCFGASFFFNNYNCQSVLKKQGEMAFCSKKESLFISVWELNQALVSSDDSSPVEPGLRQEYSFCMPINVEAIKFPIRDICVYISRCVV